ncbi:unnamed protein product [Rhizophagus irregularis]|nr:unnamed protein product [Rhizophagus irregularis]
MSVISTFFSQSGNGHAKSMKNVPTAKSGELLERKCQNVVITFGACFHFWKIYISDSFIIKTFENIIFKVSIPNKRGLSDEFSSLLCVLPIEPILISLTVIASVLTELS